MAKKGDTVNGNIENRLDDCRLIAAVEAEGICSLLSISEKAGLLYVHSAISSFREYLQKTKGPIIPSMDIEYRTFILALLEKVDEEYKEIVTKEVLCPSVQGKFFT